jgi:hypothetical protein
VLGDGDTHQRFLRQVRDQVVVSGPRGEDVPDHVADVGEGVNALSQRDSRTGRIRR